jgi:hypothetical protein
MFQGADRLRRSRTTQKPDASSIPCSAIEHSQQPWGKRHLYRYLHEARTNQSPIHDAIGQLRDCRGFKHNGSTPFAS